MKRLLLSLLCLPLAVLAGEKEYVELQSRISKMHVQYKVNDDFTVEKTSEIEIKALTDESAKKLKRREFSHSTSIEKFEVLEAYTRKAGGKKIPVPKDNYQITINKGNGKAAAIFSDRTTVTIVFPEVEKNDSVYLRIKNTETEPMFPGHFSTSAYFYSQVAHDDVRVLFDLPAKLHFKHEVRQMTEKAYNKNGRHYIELHYSNKNPIRIDRKDFSVWDGSSEAGYALSTFTDYAAIARAYADRALPKSVPNERVRALAHEIIKDEKEKKKQARLLYEWVATNISYAGNCIGVGAVVPHDTDFILDNRMGDCKDHATLLEALYRSVGIESTQALINSGSRYHLPKIPLVTSVNHVINYIPAWNKFVDSTSSDIPFDKLAFVLLDKPVIPISGDIPGRRTPSMQPGDMRQELVSNMKIHQDGSVSGDIKITLKGLPAVEARSGWRGVTRQQEKEWLERTFSSRNKVGFATLIKDDPMPLTSEFNLAFNFKRPEFILPKGTGGFYVGPLFGGTKGVYSYLHYDKEEIHGYQVSCGNGYAVERLTYEFPAGMKILAKPEDYEINENHLHFVAKYSLQGNTLKVFREISDMTPANICPAELMNKQRQTLIKIVESLRSQVIYQH